MIFENIISWNFFLEKSLFWDPRKKRFRHGTFLRFITPWGYRFPIVLIFPLMNSYQKSARWVNILDMGKGGRRARYISFLVRPPCAVCVFIFRIFVRKWRYFWRREIFTKNKFETRKISTIKPYVHKKNFRKILFFTKYFAILNPKAFSRRNLSS